MCFNELDWLAYCEANLKFAEAVCEACAPGDIVWVQDYHCELLATRNFTLKEPSDAASKDAAHATGWWTSSNGANAD